MKYVYKGREIRNSDARKVAINGEVVSEIVNKGAKMQTVSYRGRLFHVTRVPSLPFVVVSRHAV